MKIVHTVPTITKAAWGPSYVVLRLAETIAKWCDVSVRTLDWNREVYDPERVTKFPISMPPKALGISNMLLRSLERDARRGRISILHNHGLWMMPNVYPLYLLMGFARSGRGSEVGL